MGVNKRSGPQRAWYPSGPWIDGIRPPDFLGIEQAVRKLPNPDPNNYKIIKAQEIGNFLILKINYPDCTNFEGNKILLFRGVTLVDIVNQKIIDPHFFRDAKYVSPIARFVPTDEGWQMAETLVRVMT